MPDFQIQNLGHENTDPDGKGWVITLVIEVPSLTALAMDVPMACI